MPEILKLILRNAAIGALVSAVFVTALIWSDLFGLGSLLAASADGGLATALLYFFCFLTFGSVQIGIAIMHIGRARPGGDEPPSAPRLRPALVPVPLRSRAR